MTLYIRGGQSTARHEVLFGTRKPHANGFTLYYFSLWCKAASDEFYKNPDCIKKQISLKKTRVQQIFQKIYLI